MPVSMPSSEMQYQRPRRTQKSAMQREKIRFLFTLFVIMILYGLEIITVSSAYAEV